MIRLVVHNVVNQLRFWLPNLASYLRSLFGTGTVQTPFYILNEYPAPEPHRIGKRLYHKAETVFLEFPQGRGRAGLQTLGQFAYRAAACYRF